MRAALLRADLALRQPKLSSLTVFTGVTGPGLISTSPDISSESKTRTVAGRRAVRERNGTEPAGRLHSRTDADENKLGPGPARPDRLRLLVGSTYGIGVSKIINMNVEVTGDKEFMRLKLIQMR